MALQDIAKGRVLEALKDEALANEETSAYKGPIRKLLLKIPAEQRQNALAEAYRRAHETHEAGSSTAMNCSA